MKKVFIVILFLSFSLMAKAIPEWDVIKKEFWIYEPYFSMIQIHGTFMTVDGLCVEEDYIRPFNPWRKVCTKADIKNHCLEWEYKYHSTPIVYEERICIKKIGARCTKHEFVEKERALTYKIPVKKTGRPETLFEKPFTIKECE